MPIYEYQCQSCGHQFEHFQKMSDPLLTECPECGKPDLQKLVSAPAFQLKGSGWYVTDFRDSGKKPAEKTANASPDNAAIDKAGESSAPAKEVKEAKEVSKETKPKDKEV